MENQREKKPQRSKPKDAKSFIKYYGLAFELAVLNILLIYGGYLTDAYLDSTPFCILLGTFLAIAATIVTLIRFSK